MNLYRFVSLFFSCDSDDSWFSFFSCQLHLDQLIVEGS
jgi:hypothetical protein